MTDATQTMPLDRVEMPSRIKLALRYIRRNKSLAVGLFILFLLIAFTLIGQVVINPKHAYPLSAIPKKPWDGAEYRKHDTGRFSSAKPKMRTWSRDNDIRKNMIELYHAERCPYCVKVRYFMEVESIPYISKPVPLGSASTPLKECPSVGEMFTCAIDIETGAKAIAVWPPSSAITMFAKYIPKVG